MKQIILSTRGTPKPVEAPCLARLALFAALYGGAIAVLWGIAGGDSLARAGVWAIAMVAGLALLARVMDF